MRRRGGGHKRLYRIVDFRRNKDGVPGIISALEYDPNFLEAHFAVALAHRGLGRIDLAVEEFEQLAEMETSPLRQQKAFLHLAWTLLGNKQFGEAVDACELAQELGDGKEPFLNWIHGRSLIGTKKEFEKAVDLLEKAAENISDESTLYADIGNAHLGLREIRI